MKGAGVMGVVAGIVVTELLGYFVPHYEVLFYVFVAAGAVVAGAIGRKRWCGIAVALYVMAWKVVNFVLLMRAYSAEAVKGSIGVIALDWAVVIGAGVAGGIAGPWLREKYEQRRSV